MNKPSSGVPKTKRKLLGFTDNRQDAALQSGHFNDFLFVSLLRGANESLVSLREEGFDEWSPAEIDEQIRGNNRCIEIIDQMLKSGRPLPLPHMPKEFDLES